MPNLKTELIIAIIVDKEVSLLTVTHYLALLRAGGYRNYCSNSGPALGLEILNKGGLDGRRTNSLAYHKCFC